MPKGVIWRQEDIFFAAMGGGGWGAAPIRNADELADRIDKDDGRRIVMLVVAPLMHGNAQWVMWNAFMMGATAVLYTDHRYDPDHLWRLIGDEGVVSVGLVGDAMARPLAEALASAPPGTYDTSTLAAVGSGGAMLSATVKRELQEQLPNMVIMDRFGSSESGAQGAVEDGATGPRFVMGDDTSVLDDELRPLRPGDGRIGRLARTGRIPLGYYKDQDKTEATFPVDARGVRWSIPGDLASVEADGTITVHGRGSASINSGGEKIFPEEVEAAVKTHPEIFDAIVVGLPDERFGERVGGGGPATDAPRPPRPSRTSRCTVAIRSPATRFRGRCWWWTRSPSPQQESRTPRRQRPSSSQLTSRSADRAWSAPVDERRASTTRPTVETTRPAAADKMSASMSTTPWKPESGHRPRTRAGTGREGERSPADRARKASSSAHDGPGLPPDIETRATGR